MDSQGQKANSRFNFEHEVSLSETEYVRIMVRGVRWRNQRLILLLAAGIGGLFWPYTVALGIVIIGLALALMLAAGSLPIGAGAQYRESPHLQKPMRCGVSESEVWAHSSSFRFVAAWDHLRTWRECEGWLMLWPSGMGPVFLSQSQLQRAGVYEQVLALARQHDRRPHRSSFHRKADGGGDK